MPTIETTSSQTSAPSSSPLRGPHSRFAAGSAAFTNPISGAERRGQRADSPATVLRPLSLLLVDSQETDRWLQMLAGQFGSAAQTQVARSAAEALDILARGGADVVLSEYRLPDADGLGLIASINLLHPGVATILLTSHGNETVAANALKFGARDYLIKSEIDAATLRRSILDAARKASTDRQQTERLAELERDQSEMDQIVRSLSHDMTAMFMLLDHSFQRLKSAAEPARSTAEPPRNTAEPARTIDGPSQDSDEPPQKTAAADEQRARPSAGQLSSLTQQFAHVEACLRESKRFLEDLTTVARTGQIHMEPLRVELSPLVAEVIFEQRELLAERNVRIEAANDLPAVWCNPARAKQVFTNLVRNAVRHGCDPNDPRITIARYPSAASTATNASGGGFEWIAVHDNGRGIPAESRDEIFQPGRRLPTAHPDGSGMGLSIVRRIVQHYGGQVFVAPTESGTTFVLSLPKAAE